MFRRSAAVLALGLVTAALLSGCTPSPTEPAAKQVSTTELDSMLRMSPEMKRDEIAPSFPVEIPVPKGNVVRGEAQGENAWVYVLMVNPDVATTAEWYRRMLGRIEWELVDDSASVADGSARLRFTKGGAQQEIVLAPAEGGGTLVTASVGVGVPVLQTQ